MRKEIKQWGDSAVIVFTKEDLKVYNLQPGDIIDISDIVKVKSLIERSNDLFKENKEKRGKK